MAATSEPEWLDVEVVIAFHAMTLAEHGGAAGIRDDHGLRSALARPRQLLADGDPDLFDLAAAYASGIVRNHPFVDGNKRAAFIAAYTFLRVNGLEVRLAEIEVVGLMLDLAAGRLSEPAFAESLRAQSVREVK